MLDDTWPSNQAFEDNYNRMHKEAIINDYNDKISQYKVNNICLILGIVLIVIFLCFAYGLAGSVKL